MYPDLSGKERENAITKEYKTEKHIEICKMCGYEPRDIDVFAPKTLHARTAAMLIPLQYPDFADGEVVDAVRYHTTGRRGMSIAEMLLYLADYIDESRTFDDCVALRRAFWDADPAKMPEEDRLRHLYRILILSVDKTVLALLREGSPISPDSIDMRNDLLLKI
jgi:nicotinate-nucleotide adenylyltransferase